MKNLNNSQNVHLCIMHVCIYASAARKFSRAKTKQVRNSDAYRCAQICCSLCHRILVRACTHPFTLHCSSAADREFTYAATTCQNLQPGATRRALREKRRRRLLLLMSTTSSSHSYAREGFSWERMCLGVQDCGPNQS